MVKYLLLLVALSSCSEVGFSLLHTPHKAGPAGCADLELDTGRHHQALAVAVSAEGAMVFGADNGSLESWRFSDGGLVTGGWLDSVDQGLLSASAGAGGWGLAFHQAGRPTLARFDPLGRLVSPPESVLAPTEGGNAVWGLRVSGSAQSLLVVYRTLGARPALTLWNQGQLQFLSLARPAGEVDGFLAGDRVWLLLQTPNVNPDTLTRSEVTFDGGVVEQRQALTGPLRGQPFGCEAVSFFGSAGSVTTVAGATLDGGTFAVGDIAANGRLLAGGCHELQGAAVAYRSATDRLRAVHVTPSGQLASAFEYEATLNSDFGVGLDEVSVWLVAQSATTQTTTVVRRCLREP